MFEASPFFVIFLERLKVVVNPYFWYEEDSHGIHFPKDLINISSSKEKMVFWLSNITFWIMDSDLPNIRYSQKFSVLKRNTESIICLHSKCSWQTLRLANPISMSSVTNVFLFLPNNLLGRVKGVNLCKIQSNSKMGSIWILKLFMMMWNQINQKIRFNGHRKCFCSLRKVCNWIRKK